MTTYQDRARLVLRAMLEPEDWESALYGEPDLAEHIEAQVDQALSELASIVEEEIIGEDEYPNEHFETVLVGDRIKQFDDVVARDRLRAKQRDQLSNRSKSDE